MNCASIKRKLRSLLRSPARESNPHLRLGSLGERQAYRHLRRRGYRVLTRNYQCPCGEIDLVAGHGEQIVFVEVRTRSSATVEDPRDIIQPEKWRHVERAARYFLAHQSIQDRPCRFDLILVFQSARGKLNVEHIENAFQPRRG